MVRRANIRIQLLNVIQLLKYSTTKRRIGEFFRALNFFEYFVVPRELPSDPTAYFRAPPSTQESPLSRNYVSTRDVKKICAYWFRKTNRLKPKSSTNKRQCS